jgi:hypothetical protein
MKADYVDQFSIITKGGLVCVRFNQAVPVLRESGGQLRVVDEESAPMAAVLLPADLARELASKLAGVTEEHEEGEADA